MSTTVKSMKITYDAINEDNTFSSGDVITARIILEISKEAKINSLSIKAKGEAHVHWKEGHGDDERSYSANERYFKLKQFMIQPPKDDGKDSEKLLADHSGETYSDVVAPGIHLYPFTFQIPQRDMPSSFTGIHGKIAYTLEAKLSRSMRMAKTAMAEFTFITKNNMVDDTLLSSQSGSVQKKMKLFTSGNVSMNANMERMGYMQGKTV
ncbi:hypothetical protein MATL_G00065230 [Megalops atlanticus]|uniref:Arrestin-like N-terminal domain-containing protein n=1 Tax=Megalops atlanticus TaxID=7932 RepID=A0A9D3QC65_MEGAT|nr:hypothetical protein MATL_G00065230 [Megalops atlanticus]